jgi:hypothetical protein
VTIAATKLDDRHTHLIAGLPIAVGHVIAILVSAAKQSMDAST